MDLQLSEVNALVMEGAEKVKLLNASLLQSFHLSGISDSGGKSLEKKEDFPMVEEDLVRNNLGKFCTQIYGH